MNLKSILKTVKLNESSISMILGAIVVIIVGVLVFNYFKGLETGTTLPSSKQIEEMGPTVTRDGKTFHVVQSNDSLWKIAERYYDSGYNWVDIAAANELDNPGLIEMGQELYVPDVEPKQPTVAVIGISENVPAISGTTYTVVKGDNLWNIAVGAYGDGYKWQDIAKENNLVNPNIIHSGNVFTLPQ